jgi:hypothetical protein
VDAAETIPRMKVPADRGPVTACVLFLRWRDAAAAAPMAAREQRLQAVARAAIQGWDPAARVVLEAPEGLAVVATVAPSQASKGAQRGAAADADGSVVIALHHGDIHTMADPQHQGRLRGEGLDTASALAAGARGQHVLLSPAFRQAQSAEPASGRRAALRNVFGLGGLFVLLAAGVWTRNLREAYEEAHRPAVLDLDIKPWGDILVDGESKGRSPPVMKVSIPPGAHTLEIRNGNAKVLRMDLQLQPGEVLEVKHSFVSPPAARARRVRPRQPGFIDRFKFW